MLTGLCHDKDTEIALRQLPDYDSHRPGSNSAEPDFRLTVDEAYAVQNAVARLRQERGEVVAGYKVGCVKNGRPLGMESLESLPGGPLESVVRLAEHLSRGEMKLKRGQLILTGLPLPLWRVAPGDRVDVDCRVPPQHVSAVVT